MAELRLTDPRPTRSISVPGSDHRGSIEPALPRLSVCGYMQRFRFTRNVTSAHQEETFPPSCRCRRGGEWYALPTQVSALIVSVG